MVSSPPFVNEENRRIDRTRVLAEAIPLVELVGLIVAVALVPFAFVILLRGFSALSGLFMLATQFILAVGSGLVLMYVIARAVQLASE